MESDADEASDRVLPDVQSFSVKVHSSICNVLKKLVERVLQLLPTVEASRPGGTSGIQALCSLNHAVEKAKLLLEHCAESSKLFLAIKGKSIQMRCERICKNLDVNLSQIQDMVPQPLAYQISEVVRHLRTARFTLESSEEKAGNMLLSLIHPEKFATDAMEISEPDAFKDVALRLHLTSGRDLLIEKRCLRKLLEKFRNSDPNSENVVKYLFYLLKKHGKYYSCGHNENANTQHSDQRSHSQRRTSHNSVIHENLVQPVKSIVHAYNDLHTDQEQMSSLSDSGTHIPEEFRCSISLKVMFDPVVIASGKTYERIWIERWFNEGHDSCPSSQKKLPNLSIRPNSSLKDQISSWCKKNGVTVPDPHSQQTPTLFHSWRTCSSTSVISSSANSLNDVPSFLLERKAVEFLSQKDMSNVSISSSSDTSYSLDSSQSQILSTENFMSGDLVLLISSWHEDECPSYPPFSKFTCEMYIRFLSTLCQLSCELQNQVLEQIKIFLKENADTFCSSTSNNFVDALMKHLKDAHVRFDVNALKIGIQILLAFVTNTRELPSLHDDAFHLVREFLLLPEVSSETMELLQNFTSHQWYNKNIVESGALHSLVKILDVLKDQVLESAIRILCNLSMDSEIRSQIILSGCITKLISCLIGGKAAGICMKTLLNLCDFSEESRAMVAETEGCLYSVVELLDNGTRDEQEYAVALLFCLCSRRPEYCHLVMKEGVIPALVFASVNGNDQAKEIALKLRTLLKDIDFDDPLEETSSQVDSISDLSQDFNNSCKGVQPALRTAGFLRNKFKHISKLKSLVLF